MLIYAVGVLAVISAIALVILLGAILAMSGQLVAINVVFTDIKASVVGLEASVREANAAIVAKIATLGKMCLEGGILGLRHSFKALFKT